MSTELFEMELQEKGREAARTPAAITQALVKQFELFQDAAEQKMQQYWS